LSRKRGRSSQAATAVGPSSTGGGAAAGSAGLATTGFGTGEKATVKA